MPDPKHVEVPEEAEVAFNKAIRQSPDVPRALQAAAPIIASKAVDRTIGRLRQERGKLEARIERLERERDEALQARDLHSDRRVEAKAKCDLVIDRMKAWRERLWDEVHSFGRAQKRQLVVLGEDLDAAIAALDSGVDEEAQLAEADMSAGWETLETLDSEVDGD